MKTIYQRALKKFGSIGQSMKLIEEMAELTKEICKYMFSTLDAATLCQLESNIAEEIADCQIVLDQLKLIYPRWKEFEAMKLERLEELIK